MLRATALALACLITGAAIAAEPPTYGKQLEGFAYPYPLQHFDFQSQGQALQMGYMDVPAKGTANGHNVVLMHGKNFCAATWQTTLDALSQAGYRVIAVDQIGFCTSSKPAHYQYSFQQLADNTHALLASLGVNKAIVLGHSTGGMLATRYALMYPQQVERLAMVNPIGLEDWKALGVPYRTVDQWYARELKLDAEGVRNYERATYYAGRWKPEYERWVQMLVGGVCPSAVCSSTIAAIFCSDALPCPTSDSKCPNSRDSGPTGSCSDLIAAWKSSSFGSLPSAPKPNVTSFKTLAASIAPSVGISVGVTRSMACAWNASSRPLAASAGSVTRAAPFASSLLLAAGSVGCCANRSMNCVSTSLTNATTAAAPT